MGSTRRARKQEWQGMHACMERKGKGRGEEERKRRIVHVTR